VSSIYYPDETLTFGYYANGLIRQVTDPAGTVSNAYNLANRLTQTEGVTPNSTVSYGYYPGGQVSAVTSAAGVVSYALDAGDRLSAISSPADGFNYTYNTNNGLIAGVSCATSGISAAYAFDTLDRVEQMEWTVGTNILRKFDYNYNTAGMITQKITTAYGLQSTNLYEYNDLDRLTSESHLSASVTSVVDYAYDLVGNRTQMVDNGTTITYTLGQGNKLSSWGVDGTNSWMQYDAAGNVTSLYYSATNRLDLVWDSRYRIASVSTNGAIAETYSYDALGRRISISDGVTTNYLVYDGIHCVAETDSTGSLQRSYTYGPGIDNILAMTVYGGTTQTYYYVKDHLGSVQAIVDNTGTNIVESYQYDAWGNTTVFDGSGNPLTQSAIGNRYCWQGREISWKTGLYFFRARWYEPVTGRWLSNDPIGISGGLNQYVFCGNNPVNFRDPNGEFGLALTALGYVAIGVTSYGYLFTPEFDVPFNPGGLAGTYLGYALYGPEVKTFTPVVQESIRVHERRHQRQFPIYSFSRFGEKTAYQEQLDYLNEKLGLLANEIRNLDADSCGKIKAVNRRSEYESIKGFRDMYLIPIMQSKKLL